MTILLLGLAMFIVVHSVRIVVDGWRTAMIARLGPWPWKAIYSLISVAGFALIVWGYGETRGAAELWQGPAWLRPVSSLLMLVSFILLVAAYIPRNRIQTIVGHPMTAGVKVWALAHLLTNTRPGDLALFGVVLVWAVLVFRAARRRDRASGRREDSGSWTMAAIAIAAGATAWAVFARFLHPILIDVPVA
ncbi:MAG: hypothetical protein A2140_02440 [Candidatus Muproteobacteria bacterium RBG_16_62_13]|uniref:NnrU domain-containing protein n=1 Tax=Candidatus Muproteobacteria bacterium RBG_16_62_13 TaxID=1817756 RepID=A0A1F6T764_9PROT|nr:MAG: hypothetical protein A2140_02440 [Candidatus Muproteobacteria bacterium RBG_16_62_13]